MRTQARLIIEPPYRTLCLPLLWPSMALLSIRLTVVHIRSTTRRILRAPWSLVEPGTASLYCGILQSIARPCENQVEVASFPQGWCKNGDLSSSGGLVSPQGRTRRSPAFGSSNRSLQPPGCLVEFPLAKGSIRIRGLGPGRHQDCSVQERRYGKIYRKCS